MTHITGSFEVKLAPQTDSVGDASISRLAIDKCFHGALDASSQGQMLATRTSVEGSAGYVAIERVSGTLDGRRGSFSLQHSGTMNRGEASLTLTVIPDSGTDELSGLSGRMAIRIEAGAHYYDFDYALPDAGQGAKREGK